MFYGSTLLVPAVMLGVGLVRVRSRRKGGRS